MIRGVHTMFYTSEPEAMRAFFRDKLGFPAHDVGGGWLIFDLPEADLGCHPADPGAGAPTGTHAISFYCDDIEKSVAALSSRGVEFTGPVQDHGYGLVTRYGHLSKFAVWAGKEVKRGEVLGYVGATGRATGPHLHYEILANGKLMNPMQLLAGKAQD